jgi:hypothetical protein
MVTMKLHIPQLMFTSFPCVLSGHDKMKPDIRATILKTVIPPGFLLMTHPYTVAETESKRVDCVMHKKVSNAVDERTLLTTNLTRNLDLIQLIMETLHW